MTDTKPTTPAQLAQRDARQMYRDSLKAENPLTGVELGRAFERSERWGRDRIAEVKAEASSPVLSPALPEASAVAELTPPAVAEAAELPDTEPHVPVFSEPAESVTGPTSPTAEAFRPATSLPPVATEAAERQNKLPERQEPSTASEGPEATERKSLRVWPVWLLMAPAAVAIWGGWVGLGEMAGFGPVNLLPGIADVEINTAITLPIGMEVYAAYALYVWLSGRAVGKAKAFAKRSAITSLVVGALGQIAYHVMEAAGVGVAPWYITAAVACLPVAVLGMGAALAHMVKADAE